MSLPGWTHVLLRWAAPSDRAEDLIGDLEEVHRERVRTHGTWLATILTVVEVGETAVILIVARAREARAGRRGRRHGERSGRVSVSWVDVKLGLRMLRKYPVLTGVSILPMAVVVAAAAGVYAATANILHPRLPFPDGDRIVGIEYWNASTQSAESRLLHDFALWREELGAVADLGAFEMYRPSLILDDGRAEPLFGSKISASAFRVTRVRPLLGRPLLDSDEEPGAPDVVVIGYDLWRNLFGGDAGVLGRTIRLGETSSVIVGVMPPDFAFPYNDEIWVPLRHGAMELGPLEGPHVYVFGRLRDGVDVTAAKAELEVLTRRAAVADPEAYRAIRARVVPYGVNLWGGPWQALTGLRVAFVVLLLVVCSTVGALVFVRNLSREAEVTVRFFLGASRGRIVAQLFTESLVMAAVGSILGLMLMTPALRWVYATAASASAGEGGLPFWVRAELTPGIIYYAVALTLLSAAFAGLLPALTLTRERGRSGLQRLGFGSGAIRLGPKGTIAIAGQTALTVGLLALLGGRWPGMVAGMRDGSPIDTRSYLTATYRPGQVPATNEQKDRVLRRVLESSMAVAERLAADPDVAGVTLGSTLPGHAARQWEIEVEGRMEEGAARRAHLAWVDTGYFSVLNIPVLAGRSFDARDLSSDGSSPLVAIVNQSFAKQWFGERSPLGERVRFVGAITAYPGDPAQHPWAEIVGVVSDVGMSHRHPARPRALYLPLRTGTYPLRMAVHARRDPADISARVRTTSDAVDPWLRLTGMSTLKNVVDRAQAAQRTIFSAILLATAAALALSLSALYAVVSFLVARRTREIGIRIALGGRPIRVAAGVLAASLRQVAAGVAAGLAAMWLFRVVSPVPLSWEAVLIASAATLAAGFAATVSPALRAAGVQPTEAIRTER